ncbi:acetyltransferase [Fonsecaea pedrosoi]|nr:acetyltransferase [Fonsecaea pedrosoi]
MLVHQQHPPPLPTSPSLAPPANSEYLEYSYNAHISSPAAVQLRTKPIDIDPLPPRKKLAFSIRPATIADAPAIARLGATVFATTFGFSIPTNDLKAYLTEAYSVEAIEEDIRCATKHILVTCLEDQTADNDEASGQEIIGFAQLTEGTSEPCISDVESVVELQRLYVSTACHGHGVGKLLANQIEGVARRLGYRAMWLGVWEGNFRAQKVYEGLGFIKVGDHEFKMGKCIQIDWIMLKDL